MVIKLTYNNGFDNTMTLAKEASKRQELQNYLSLHTMLAKCLAPTVPALIKSSHQTCIYLS